MSYAEINNEFVEKIDRELDRLGLSTDFAPCSGLMAESVDNAEAVVKIYDDYVSGEYYADRVLEILESLDMDPDENVWKLIAKAEI